MELIFSIVDREGRCQSTAQRWDLLDEVPEYAQWSKTAQAGDEFPAPLCGDLRVVARLA